MERLEPTSDSATSRSSLADPHPYLSHYGLQAPPFRVTTDPRLLWLGTTRAETLATLTEAIRHGDGILLLTGGIGTGKTSLANRLVDTLREEELVIGRIASSGFETSDFFQAVAHAYGITETSHTKDAFFTRFRRLLGGGGSDRKKALLIIDEAQELSDGLLGEIRDLSITGAAKELSLAILLVGETELSATLSEDRHAALRQRIATRCAVGPLTQDEVGEYIRHHLKMGGSEEEIFSAGAIREIASLSAGVPRVINMTCHLALLTGHGRQARTISGEIIEECRKKLGSPGRTAASQGRDPARLRHVARGARDGAARQRRGRSGTGRAAPVYAGLFGAAILIAGVYSLYGGWVTEIRHGSTRAAPRDSSGEKRDPQSAAGGTVSPARDAADEALNKAESPVSSPKSDATELPADPAARQSEGPLAAKATPPAPVKDAKPKDPPPRASVAPLEAKTIPPAKEANGGPGASGAPVQKTQAHETEVESPDPAGVIDWLLRQHSPVGR